MSGAVLTGELLVGLAAVVALPALAFVVLAGERRPTSPKRLRSIAPDVAEVLDGAWHRISHEFWLSMRPRLETLVARRAKVVAVTSVGADALQTVVSFDDGSELVLTAPDREGVASLAATVPDAVLVDGNWDARGVLRFSVGEQAVSVRADIIRLT